MADKPILFSGPMVRALLAGTKTQTRRAYNGAVDFTEWLASETIEDMELRGWSTFEDANGNAFMAKVPIYVGDRLYVREHWYTDAAFDDTAPRDLEPGTIVRYEADGERHVGIDALYPGRFRQGMHMPKWASRITLHVTEVRVQRLQEIDRDDAKAEGIPEFWHDAAKIGLPRANEDGGHVWDNHTSVENYRMLWEAINGPGSWDSNPWVAAYTFAVGLGNIDQAQKRVR